MFSNGDIIIHKMGEGSMWVRHYGLWICPEDIKLDGTYSAEMYDDQWAEAVLLHGFGRLYGPIAT